MPANGTSSYLQMTQDVFQSYTGADIQASITMRGKDGNMQHKVFASLASITISTVREVNPLWAMGSADYRSVSKGKRSNSGTLVFTVFDRDPLVRDLVEPSDIDQLKSQWEGLTASALPYSNVGITRSIGRMREAVTAAIDATKALSNLVGQQPVRYADQLAPFDITISLVNDQGSASVASVRQITIVSQGIGWSMHELESDMVYQYICRYYEPLQNITQSTSAPALSWNRPGPQSNG